ncbi:hypothetical protein T01_2962 [Trichinella spiralis]|uniref:Integrase catalytic domain-containing protein n=1 Tax=Trichinella spiralis TaxID=6334 RepID=A0A0V1AQ61_TRISP|nr:hypothetical protein T01_2962 [Trichinella spiralis]
MSARAREKSKKLIIGKERLNRLFEELDQLCMGPAEVLEIGEQISMIERLFRETDALQVELELNLEEEERRMAEEDWSKYRKGFRERKVRALALMQSKGSDCSGRLDDQGIELRSGPGMVPAATSMHELAARLPRCDLPKFSGDFTEFRAFWDQFDYRVHQRMDLSNAAKLTYLRGCLTGKAADVISSLSSSNADYEVALNRLREEFDRPAKVIRHQIKKLVQTPPKDVGLRSQYDHLRRTIDALTALGKDPRKGGLREGELSAAEITIAISRDRLPTPVRIKWDEKTKANETMAADLSEYLQFLGEQAQLLEESRSDRSEPAKLTKPAKRRSSPLRRRHDEATVLQTAVADRFAVCEESPRAAETSELGRPTRQSKTRTPQRAGRCFYCQKHGHIKRNCPDRMGHLATSGRSTSGERNSDLSGPKAGKGRKTTEPRKAQVNIATTKHGWSRFQMIKAVAHGAHGRKRLVNCLLDTGAERSLVRQDVADELKLAGEVHPTSFRGVGGSRFSCQASRLVRLWLSPVSGEHAGDRYELEAMTAPVLCEDLWQTPVSPNDWPHLQSLNLTREVGELTPVHVIIGLDSYFRFLGRQVIRGGDGDPVAVETRFGWIICGPAALSGDRECRVHCIRTDDRLNAALRKFWELEAIGILPPETESGQTEMERRFKESLSFDGNRYSVGLLWKPGMASLPNNYATAIRRYRSLEKRLSRDSGFDKDYTTVMQSYFDNGWAEEAPASKTPGKTWYLPHHAVYQQGTTGRKFRIVFDGSAVHRGTSLNDHLESGPNLHVDLMGILLRFRRFRVGLQADIEKMYLQVGLHPEDRDACRFLWRGAGGGRAPREYRLTRVCFGLTCSPFLAIQTIRTHAENSQHAGDKTARLITSNMYVDDLVLSCDSIEEAKKLVHESKSLFGKGGFNLTGFVSNCSSVVGYDGALPFGKDPKPAGRLLKTLGVLWDTESDQLSFRQPEVDAEEQDTKRTLLSLAATIFDPLGYLTPFTVRAKMLLQLLWQEGTSWDDPLPVPVEAVWRNWKGELADLSQVSIDRACIKCSLMELVHMDLHGFADASGSAYGAVVYLRLVHGNGKVEVRFLAAKSRVAPIKKLSLPRLELMAALLCARLVAYVKRKADLPIRSCFCWSDSSVALCWIRSNAQRWKPFVSNRVRDIQEITSPDSWRYCPTQDNPADLASRGCPLSKLAAGSLWHSGPRWLQLDESAWPKLKISHGRTPENMELENRKTVLVMTTSVKFDLRSVMDVARYSSYGKLVRVTAWCLRFIFNARSPMELRQKARGLTVPEMREAEKTWIRQVQVSAYGPGSHRRKDLQQFNPYLDEDGILRVGGRLAFSELPQETRNPMLLPHGDGVVKLLIQHVHEQQLHAGVDQTLAATRKRFWITRGRSAVKEVVRKCVVCRRVTAKPFEQQMAELPPERTEPVGPFVYVGVDFAGPIMARCDGKTLTLLKTYVCIFTCMVVRAIHLELVPDMTVDSFLRALRRFISRRGRPRLLQSDNFQTFHLASRFLRPLCNSRNWKVVQDHLAKEGIEWKFITERAPWCGGYWERLVRSIKVALSKVLGRCHAKPDELRTVLCEIEARINDRPLTIVSDRPDDQLALTPAHFLIGRELSSLPDRDCDGKQVQGDNRVLSRLHRRWRYQRRLVDHLWTRWKQEYLVTLSSRGKWRKLQEKPRIGDVVLIIEPNIPRSRAPFGRIVELFCSRDGMARSARLQTARGLVTRSVRSLVLLEPGAN